MIKKRGRSSTSGFTKDCWISERLSANGSELSTSEIRNQNYQKRKRNCHYGWTTVAFAKGIEGMGEILTMLNKELTEEEIDQSIRILTEIYNDHPEMLGG
tara:strand:+ start:1442 stop:1741 length:300 start_codon:yes stop_codon:yes gene_type:complete